MPSFSDPWDAPFYLCPLHARVHATMYYPSESHLNRRQALACSLSAPTFNLWEYADDAVFELSAKDLWMLAYRKDIEDFGQSESLMFPHFFYAAHWLRYRLYSAANCPEISSNNEWEFYVRDELQPKLPAHWPFSKKTIQEARMTYAPVAHLWLAWLEPNYSGLNPSRKFPPPQRPRGHNPTAHFLGRAKTYLNMALELGIFDDIRAKPRPADLWYLPEDIEPYPVPAITSPDLIYTAFDAEEARENYRARERQAGASPVS